MSSLSIPFALGPHGNEVPIDESIRFKTDYYRCPECGEIVNPRKGEKRRYYAHKSGVLDETTCSLSSQEDVEEMVDELRRSDIEKGEENRDIRIYLGEEPGGNLQIFGVLPSLDWNAFPPGADVDSILGELEISASGVERPPVAKSFHPSEPEVRFELDPSADGYLVNVDGPNGADSITGEWTTEGCSEGDLFVGDQTRARRFHENRQIKRGEWVYIFTDDVPSQLPDIVETYAFAGWTVLAFPAREQTESLLARHSTGLTTDDYGFDADVVLPPRAHPTSDAPISSTQGEAIFVGVVPAPTLDPTFEIVSIPKRDSDTVELESTGPGNPRYFRSTMPKQGSKRISVHQRNSSRHRLIHLHADESDTDSEESVTDEMAKIGLEVRENEGTTLLTALAESVEYQFPEDFQPMTLPAEVDYIGPKGLDIELIARFPASYSGTSPVTRTTNDLESQLPNIGHWVQQGCTDVTFDFDGLGTITFDFSSLNQGGSA